MANKFPIKLVDFMFINNSPRHLPPIPWDTQLIFVALLRLINLATHRPPVRCLVRQFTTHTRSAPYRPPRPQAQPCSAFAHNNAQAIFRQNFPWEIYVPGSPLPPPTSFFPQLLPPRFIRLTPRRSPQRLLRPHYLPIIISWIIPGPAFQKIPRPREISTTFDMFQTRIQSFSIPQPDKIPR